MHCYVFEKEATNDCPFQSLCQMVLVRLELSNKKLLELGSCSVLRPGELLEQFLSVSILKTGCLWLIVLQTTEGCGSCCGTSVQGGAFFLS